MKSAPEVLGRIADVVLAYRPAAKKKKLAAKAKKAKPRNKSTSNIVE